MNNEPSIDTIWWVIEKFGIQRKLIDPHQDVAYHTIHNLYLTVKNQNSSTQRNSVKIQLKQPTR